MKLSDILKQRLLWFGHIDWGHYRYPQKHSWSDPDRKLKELEDLWKFVALLPPPFRTLWMVTKKDKKGTKSLKVTTFNGISNIQAATTYYLMLKANFQMCFDYYIRCKTLCTDKRDGLIKININQNGNFSFSYFLYSISPQNFGTHCTYLIWNKQTKKTM